MPRKLRVQYPGAMYHVMSRGDQRDDNAQLVEGSGNGYLRIACDYLRRLEEVSPEALDAFRREWCLGGQTFRQEHLARMEGGLGEHHAGELRREAAEAKAERNHSINSYSGHDESGTYP